MYQGGQELDLLAIRCDHADILLLDSAMYQSRNELLDMTVVSDLHLETMMMNPRRTRSTSFPSISFCTRSPTRDSRAESLSVFTNTQRILSGADIQSRVSFVVTLRDTYLSSSNLLREHRHASPACGRVNF